MLVVTNLKNVDVSKPNIYLGRAGNGLKRSPLGNPFKITKNRSRDQAIEEYRQWLYDQLMVFHSGPVVKEIFICMQLHATKKTTVQAVCHCAPEPCHVDVIIRCCEWLIANPKIMLQISENVINWY